MTFDADDVGENIRRNIVSNYLALGLRMLRGVVLFRLLYEELNAEEFGYWSLLWSVFGFGILLDFGFGLTIQRTVARLTADKAWTQLNQALSTIMILYCGLGLVLGLIGVATAGQWMRWVDVSAANQSVFHQVFLWFIAAMALKFPLTVFSEVLRAQQRIALLNWIAIWTSLVGLGVIGAALWLDWGFLTIVQIAVVETQVPAVIAAYYMYRDTPSIQLRLSHFSRGELKEATKFSAVAYIIMLTYMLSTKTGLLIISTMMSLSAAAMYQPSAKVAEVFGFLTKQLPDVLQPAAAHLYAKRDHDGLRDLQRNGVRFSALIATPVWIATAFYMPWLIEVLTGTEHPTVTTIAVGEALIFWAYGYVVAHDVYKRIALMTGQEHRLMWVGLLEMVSNLTLSILLLKIGWGLVGVALGTTITGTMLGCCFFWRWAAQQADETYFGLIRVTLLRTWLACVPLVALLGVGLLLGLLTPDNGVVPFSAFLALALVATVVAIMTGAWEPGERAMVVQRLPAPLRRFAQARFGQGRGAS